MSRGTKLKAWLIMIMFFMVTVFTVAAGRTIYVDNYGTGDFNNIQAAINDSNDGDTIIVADGTYTGDGNRDIDFFGKAITLRSENGPQNCIIDCNGSEADPHRGLYFHNGEDPNSVLDGFTIINGYGPNNGDLFSHGGAIFCVDSSPTISYCTFTSNWAEFGGGIECRQSSARILNSTFTGNFANSFGGGLHFREGNPIISHCTIANNTSVREGGGINYGGNQNPTISYCTISGNSAIGWGFGGGGINLSIGKSTTAARISHCTISRNFTDYSGGGIRLDGPITHSPLANVTITNCIITENSDEMFGGGIAFWGGNYVVDNCTISANTGLSKGTGIYCNASNVRVTNSVIWSPIYGYEIMLDFTLVGVPGETVFGISYSNVDGGQTEVVYMVPYNCTLNWGPGNIDADPCFADPNNDYHLKSQAGRWDPNSQSWVQDAVTSPCIDAGNPGCPLVDEPVPNGNRRNMGAYGGTAEASKSPLYWRSIADLTNDWAVDSNDLKVFVDYWLETGGCVPSDLNRSQSVDFADFALLANNWGRSSPGKSVFDFAVATKGPLHIAGNIEPEGPSIFIEANVYIQSLNSSLALEMIGNSHIAGDVFIVNPFGTVDIYGVDASIGGETVPGAFDHVFKGVSPIEFPVPNPGYFEHYVVSDINYPSTETTFENIRIPPNTNPSFSGGTMITGVVFVEIPNVVTFTGNVTITGIIVGNGNITDDSGTNRIDFLGTVDSASVSELPVEYGDLRDETGTFLMAPGFSLSFGADLATINGAIAANGIQFYGNAGGTIQGSVLNYSDTPMELSGNNYLYFHRFVDTEIPAGFE